MQQREWTTQNFSRKRKLQLLWRTVFCLPLLGLWHELLVTGSWVKSSEKVEALLRARTLASTDLFSSIFQCASSRTTFPVCLWSLYSLHSMSPKQIKGQTRCLRLECLEPPFFPSSIATWQMIEHDNFSEGMVSQEGHDYPTNKSWVKTIWVGKHGSTSNILTARMCCQLALI